MSKFVYIIESECDNAAEWLSDPDVSEALMETISRYIPSAQWSVQCQFVNLPTDASEVVFSDAICKLKSEINALGPVEEGVGG